MLDMQLILLFRSPYLYQTKENQTLKFMTLNFLYIKPTLVPSFAFLSPLSSSRAGGGRGVINNNLLWLGHFSSTVHLCTKSVPFELRIVCAGDADFKLKFRPTLGTACVKRHPSSGGRTGFWRQNWLDTMFQCIRESEWSNSFTWLKFVLVESWYYRLLQLLCFKRLINAVFIIITVLGLMLV